MFRIHTVDGGHIPAFEYLPASAIKPQIGMALTQSGGNLAAATGSTKPTYISMCEKSATLTAGDLIPVIRVSPDIIFAAESSAAMTSIKKGDKVTIDGDGLKVTATTQDASKNAIGVAEVVGMDGTGQGDIVYVRFS